MILRDLFHPCVQDSNFNSLTSIYDCQKQNIVKEDTWIINIYRTWHAILLVTKENAN